MEIINYFIAFIIGVFFTLIIFVIRAIAEDKKPKNKVRFYVARDGYNNTLYLYLGKPCRKRDRFCSSENGRLVEIQDYFYKIGLNYHDFKDLKFEDEPVEVFLNLED